jgi:hypothetical protein
MSIDRTNYNALVDDDGSNTVGSIWNKQAIKNVLLDPIDAAIAGTWIDIPFSAANFGATGGTWTVTSGNVTRFSYALLGKTALVQLFIGGGSVVGGTPSSLNLVMPFTIAAGQSGPVYFYVAPDYGWGIYEQPTVDQYMRLKRDAFSTPFAAASGCSFRFSAAVQIL